MACIVLTKETNSIAREELRELASSIKLFFRKHVRDKKSSRCAGRANLLDSSIKPKSATFGRLVFKLIKELFFVLNSVDDNLRVYYDAAIFGQRLH